MQRVTSWFLRNSVHPLEVTNIMNRYKEGVKILLTDIVKILDGKKKESYEEKKQFYNSIKLPKDLVQNMAVINNVSAACDIVFIATEHNIDFVDVAKLFFAVESHFNFDFIDETLGNLPFENYWQKLSIKTLREDLNDKLRRLTIAIIKECYNETDPIKTWSRHHIKEVTRFQNFIKDLGNQETIDFSMLVVAGKRVDALFVGTAEKL